MAHFRAVIQGSRGEASRLGHKSTGLSVKAQTWGWDLSVFVAHRDGDGHDVAHVELRHHSTGERRPLPSINLTTGEVIK